MRPVYENGCVSIYHGDFREVTIPKVAVAVLDPPYNLGKPNAFNNLKDRNGTVRGKTFGQSFSEDFDENSLLPRDWIPYMPDTVITFYAARGMEVLLRSFRKGGYEIVQDFHWCKPNPLHTLRSFGFAWAVEFGFVFRKKGTKHVVNKRVKKSLNYIVDQAPRKKGLKVHTTQKPLRVMRWLIQHYTLPETMVVDMFLGSGTTGVAAVELGRGFIGVEQKKDYCDLAVRRIREAIRHRQSGFQIPMR